MIKAWPEVRQHHRPLTYSLDYGKEQAVEQHTCETSGCDQTEKVCVKCDESKPLTEYPRRARGKDGHRNDCKVCVSAYRKAWHEDHREEQNARQNKWYWDNIDENRAKARAYVKANREQTNARSKAWRKANPERYRANVLRQREADPERYSNYIKEYHAKRWANDPEYRERLNNRRGYRSRMLETAVQEPYLRDDIFERDGWICQLCQEPIDSELKWPDRHSASIDHVLPLSLGGDDTPVNVQAAHLTCNVSKNNRVELDGDQAA